jgi:hypothetical protein
MKEKQTIIKIGYSCDANWQKMSSTEQGKFCHSCNKEVVDFTHFSDNRLIDYLENSTTSVCGKVNNHQLNRTLISPRTYHLPQFSKIYKFLASIFFATIISRVAGQEPVQNEATEQHQPSTDVTTSNSRTENIIIKGQIFDESTNEPVPFIKVFLTEDPLRYGCMSDFDGKFELKIDKKSLTDTSSITLRSMDYLEKTIVVKNTNLDSLNILRIEDSIVIIQNDPRMYQTIGIVIMEKPIKSKRRARKERRHSRKEE